MKEKLSISQFNDSSNDANFIKSINQNNKGKSINQEIIDELDNQIDQVRNDISKWDDTNKDLNDFIERNNLNQTMLQLFGDQIMLGLCFPEIQLQSTYIDNGKPVSGANWKTRLIVTGKQIGRAHV